MLARTKLTDLKSGQEYLLFVSKMNLKGLLVSSLPQLPLESLVKLQLSLGNKKKQSIEVDGAIYKNISNPQGTKGTIIRFININQETENQLKQFIADYEKETQKVSQKKEVNASLIEKTTMVNESSLSHLALASPDRESGVVAYTIDEEAALQGEKGLSGNTVIGRIRNVPKRRDRNRLLRALIVVVISLVSVCAVVYQKQWLAFLNARFSKTRAILKSLPGATPSTTPEPTSEKPIVEGLNIGFLDAPDSVIVTLVGNHDFATHFISKNLEPKRLIIDLPELPNTLEESSVNVNIAPVGKVRATKQQKGMRIYFDLSATVFPKYTVQKTPDGLSITFLK